MKSLNNKHFKKKKKDESKSSSKKTSNKAAMKLEQKMQKQTGSTKERLASKMSENLKSSKFRYLNEQLYRNESVFAAEMFKESPHLFDDVSFLTRLLSLYHNILFGENFNHLNDFKYKRSLFREAPRFHKTENASISEMLWSLTQRKDLRACR